MAVKKELIQFTIENDTNCSYNIPLFQQNVYSINATTKYSWNVTTANLSCGTGSIVINGITYNITYTPNLSGLLQSLNALGFGFFCFEIISGQTYIYTTDDVNVYGNLSLCSTGTTTTTTSTSTTAAPTTTTTTSTSTTTATPTTTTTTSTSTTTAAPTTTTTTSTSTTTAAPTTTTTTSTSTTTAAPTTTTTTSTTTTISVTCEIYDIIPDNTFGYLAVDYTECNGNSNYVSVLYPNTAQICAQVGSVTFNSGQGTYNSSSVPCYASVPFNVRLSNVSAADACLQSAVTIYLADNGCTITTGCTLYLDAAMTTPVTGYSWVVYDVPGSSVYDVNSATGVIGSVTGTTC